MGMWIPYGHTVLLRSLDALYVFNSAMKVIGSSGLALQML